MKKILVLIIYLNITSISKAIDITLNRVDEDENIVTQIRDIKNDFSKILVNNGLDVYIIQSTKMNLKVEADETIIDKIKTEVQNDVLKIYFKGGVSLSSKTKKIHLSINSLNKIKSTTGSNVYIETLFNTSKMDLLCTSGATIDLNLHTDTIFSKSTSGSKIKLKGNTNYHKAKANSAGKINAFSLKAKTVNIKASTGAKINVWVFDSLLAKANSAAKIKYKGSPKTVLIETSDFAKVVEVKK